MQYYSILVQSEAIGDNNRQIQMQIDGVWNVERHMNEVLDCDVRAFD